MCILCMLRFKHIQSKPKNNRRNIQTPQPRHGPHSAQGAQHFAGVDVALWAGAIGWGPGVGILAECDMNWRFLKETSVKICYNLKIGTKISSWITLISWSTSWESARLAFDFATFATLHTSTLPSAPSVLSPHAMHQMLCLGSPCNQRHRYHSHLRWWEDMPQSAPELGANHERPKTQRFERLKPKSHCWELSGTESKVPKSQTSIYWLCIDGCIRIPQPRHTAAERRCRLTVPSCRALNSSRSSQKKMRLSFQKTCSFPPCFLRVWWLQQKSSENSFCKNGWLTPQRKHHFFG